MFPTSWEKKKTLASLLLERYCVGFLMGLKCSSEKSELSNFKCKKLGRRPKNWVPEVKTCITACTSNESLVPKVDGIRVFGFVIYANKSNNITIQRITKKTQ